MTQDSFSKEGGRTAASMLSSVLRVLDAENRLIERADQKAISLLAALGVFMVFFIAYLPRHPD